MASVRPNGSNLLVLGEGHDPCLSPEGKTIAYTGEVPGVPGGVTVFVMDFEGGNKRQVVPGASKPGAVFPIGLRMAGTLSIPGQWARRWSCSWSTPTAATTTNLATPSASAPQRHGRRTETGSPSDLPMKPTGETRNSWPRFIRRNLRTNVPFGLSARMATMPMWSSACVSSSL